MKPEILTHSGRAFDLLAPAAADIQLADIAWALSHLCRFTGHTRTFYSVAEHCIRTAWLVEPQHKLEALLHDATEAYLGDVSTPLKTLLPEYKRIEARLGMAIRQRFGLPVDESREVKRADLRMLATERRHLMPPTDIEWDILQGVPLGHAILVPMEPQTAYDEFMGCFADYSLQREAAA